MSSNFAPYQDESPEIERALSPPPLNRSRPSIDSSRARSPPIKPQHVSRNIAEVQQSEPLPPPESFGDDFYGGGGGAISNEERGRNLEAFQTSLPMRLDYEAMLAYLLLPPAGGVFLLLMEHKSDYVRFHAWQSSMVFSVMFVLHLIFAWSSFLSWLLLAIDLVLIGFLSLHAYRDVDTLDHYEVPFFGRIANRFVDDE